jgi:hypothetical protein
MKKAGKEEWVELTDGKRKIIMPRREMVNLWRRVSRVFATVKVIDPPLDVNLRTGKNVRSEPLFRHHCFAIKTKPRRRKPDAKTI